MGRAPKLHDQRRNGSRGDLSKRRENKTLVGIRELRCVEGIEHFVAEFHITRF